MTPADVVRKFFERVAGDDTDGILELLDPDVVGFGTRGGLDQNRVVRGADAFLDYLEEVEQTWEHFTFEVERVVEFDERVVAFLRETAQSRDALHVQRQTAVVLRIRDGRIAEARGYLDRDEALEAAGGRG